MGNLSGLGSIWVLPPIPVAKSSCIPVAASLLHPMPTQQQKQNKMHTISLPKQNINIISFPSYQSSVVLDPPPIQNRFSQHPPLARIASDYPLWFKSAHPSQPSVDSASPSDSPPKRSYSRLYRSSLCFFFLSVLASAPTPASIKNAPTERNQTSTRS